MQSSDEVQLGRKASLIDGASDSEEEEEPALKQSEHEDEAHEAEEVCTSLRCACADLFGSSRPRSRAYSACDKLSASFGGNKKLCCCCQKLAETTPGGHQVSKAALIFADWL